jgi:hypothetical protein
VAYAIVWVTILGIYEPDIRIEFVAHFLVDGDATRKSYVMFGRVGLNVALDGSEDCRSADEMIYHVRALRNPNSRSKLRICLRRNHDSTFSGR